jgi:hypothetical protein
MPLCGRDHEPCSAVPPDMMNGNGAPIGLWDIERCTGGDRNVCFLDGLGNPALFEDETVEWWNGDANPSGQVVQVIHGTSETPSTGCVIETDACATGFAAATTAQVDPNNGCILGMWGYACSTGIAASGRVCADDSPTLMNMAGYTCSEIAADGLCSALHTAGGRSLVGICGCSCRQPYETSAPAPAPEPPSHPASYPCTASDAAHLCLNGAQCHHMSGHPNAVCTCASGWSGDHCEVPVVVVVDPSTGTTTDCDWYYTHNWCRNGGRCYLAGTSAVYSENVACLCPYGWAGAHCELANGGGSGQ